MSTGEVNLDIPNTHTANLLIKERQTLFKIAGGDVNVKIIKDQLCVKLTGNSIRLSGVSKQIEAFINNLHITPHPRPQSKPKPKPAQFVELDIPRTYYFINNLSLLQNAVNTAVTGISIKVNKTQKRIELRAKQPDADVEKAKTVIEVDVLPELKPYTIKLPGWMKNELMKQLSSELSFAKDRHITIYYFGAKDYTVSVSSKQGAVNKQEVKDHALSKLGVNLISKEGSNCKFDVASREEFYKLQRSVLKIEGKFYTFSSVEQEQITGITLLYIKMQNGNPSEEDVKKITDKLQKLKLQDSLVSVPDLIKKVVEYKAKKIAMAFKRRYNDCEMVYLDQGNKGCIKVSALANHSDSIASELENYLANFKKDKIDVKTPHDGLFSVVRKFLNQILYEYETTNSNNGNDVSDYEGNDDDDDDDDDDSSSCNDNDTLPGIIGYVFMHKGAYISAHLLCQPSHNEDFESIKSRVCAFMTSFQSKTVRSKKFTYNRVKDSIAQLDCIVTVKSGKEDLDISLKGSAEAVERAQALLKSANKEHTKYADASSDLMAEYIRIVQKDQIIDFARRFSEHGQKAGKVVALIKPVRHNKAAIFQITATADSVDTIWSEARKEILKLEDNSAQETVLINDPYEVKAIFKMGDLLSKLNKLRSRVFQNHAKSPSIALTSFDFGPEQNISIDVVQAKLKTIKTDVIFNAANEQLRHQGGIANAIMLLAGPDYDEKSQQSVMENGIVPTGTARLQLSGALYHKQGVKYIAHVVAPIFRGGVEVNKYSLLEDAVLDALKKSNEVGGVSSVGIPLIGSGIFGGDPNLTANAVVSALTLAYKKGYLSNLKKVVLFDQIKDKVQAFNRALYRLSNQTNSPSRIEKAECLQILPPNYVWFWYRHETSEYIPYDYDQVVALEDTYNSERNIADISGDFNGKPSDSKHIPQGYTSARYIVDMTNKAKMFQMNVVSKYKRCVKREKYVPGMPLPPLYEERKAEAERQWTSAQNRIAEEMPRLYLRKKDHCDTQSRTSLLIIAPSDKLPEAKQLLTKNMQAIWNTKQTSFTGSGLISLPHVQQELDRLHVRAEVNTENNKVVLTFIAERDFKAAIGILHEAQVKLKFVPPWIQTLDSTPSTNPECNLVEVIPGSEEYRKVATLFADGSIGKTIKQIHRVQNEPLWRQYAVKKQFLAERHDVNERYMFHGSRNTDPEIIANDGFDFRFSNPGLFGRGSYFAENISYSDSYAHTNSNGERQVFIARVAAGNIEERELNRDSSIVRPSNGFDSIRGLVTTSHHAIIVYDLAQAYPEYLVTYK